MWLNELSKRWLGLPTTGRPARSQTRHRRSTRLTLEHLENRTVPSTFNAATVSDLIADINAANAAGGSNTITLIAPTTAPYNLIAVDNTTDGATGLPVVAAKDNLTILGNGDTIARSAGPAFRLFDVASGASLTLQNLTLQGGWALGSGVSAEGGGIYNQGTLDLNGVTVQNNVAQGNNGGLLGRPGQNAAGGGIYSSGALTLEGGTTVHNNQALGGAGGISLQFGGATGGAGGSGFGGGLYVSGGGVTLINSTLSSNTAQGGQGGFGGIINKPVYGYGGAGGNGFGGGLYAGGGAVSLRSATVDENTAQGGAGGRRRFGPRQPRPGRGWRPLHRAGQG